MKNKLFKIIGIIFIVLVIFNIVNSIVSISHALSDVTANPGIWIDTNEDVGEGTLNNKAKPILTIIRVFGIIVSVITLAIIALKIMFASLEEKAAYKQMLLPWAAGAIMIFAMTTIPGIIYDVAQSGGASVETGEELVFVYPYCVNGNYMVVVREGSYGVDTLYSCQTDDCSCGDLLGERAYGCPSCRTKLEKIHGYLYCPVHGKAYID